MRTTGALAIALVRVAVGAAMLLAPRAVMRLGTEDASGAMVLLTRTIGIRDVVIGTGTLVALRSGDRTDARRWMTAALASDALDAVAGATSARLVGVPSAVLATGMAVPLACADLWVLRAGEGAPAGV